MKKSLMILLCLSLPFFLMGQETIKRKEIGLSFSNLDNFGLTYRTGTETSLWRFNTLFIVGGMMKETADTVYSKHSNSGIGIQVGKEYRKLLIEKLELRLGMDLSFTYTKFKTDDNSNRYYYNFQERTTYTPGIKFVVGLNYLLTPNLVIGAELLPGVFYSTGTLIESRYNTFEKVKSNISGFSYGLTNSSALLSLVYRL